MGASPETGVLLVNLGTPSAPTPDAVRRYLGQFLADPRVLDMPALVRWLLLHLVILPFRSPRSAHAYAQIWTEAGSPLLVHGRALREAVAERLGPGFRVALAMRYGEPTIAEAIGELNGCDPIVLLPLYPQTAASTVGSTVEAVQAALDPERRPRLRVIAPFYDRPEFLEPQAALAARTLDEQSCEHVLFSFHGLPARHVRRADPTGAHCLASPTCCDAIDERNRDCYRAQCFATARSLAARLSLPASGFTAAFQSRFGPTEWIGPDTVDVIDALAARGVRRLAVACPAFVADCLETLEEIGIRARARFAEKGGELALVPCVDADPAWVDGVVALIRETVG